MRPVYGILDNPLLVYRQPVLMWTKSHKIQQEGRTKRLYLNRFSLAPEYPLDEIAHSVSGQSEQGQEIVRSLRVTKESEPETASEIMENKRPYEESLTLIGIDVGSLTEETKKNVLVDLKEHLERLSEQDSDSQKDSFEVRKLCDHDDRLEDVLADLLSRYELLPYRKEEPKKRRSLLPLIAIAIGLCVGSITLYRFWPSENISQQRMQTEGVLLYKYFEKDLELSGIIPDNNLLKKLCYEFSIPNEQLLNSDNRSTNKPSLKMTLNRCPDIVINLGKLYRLDMTSSHDREVSENSDLFDDIKIDPMGLLAEKTLEAREELLGSLIIHSEESPSLTAVIDIRNWLLDISKALSAVRDSATNIRGLNSQVSLENLQDCPLLELAFKTADSKFDSLGDISSVIVTMPFFTEKDWERSYLAHIFITSEYMRMFCEKGLVLADDNCPVVDSSLAQALSRVANWSKSKWTEALQSEEKRVISSISKTSVKNIRQLENEVRRLYRDEIPTLFQSISNVRNF